MSDKTIADRARHVERLYRLFEFEDALWEDMTPQEAYKRGQVMIARYIAIGPSYRPDRVIQA